MNNRLLGSLLVGGTTAVFATYGVVSREIPLNAWQLTTILNFGGALLGYWLADGTTFTLNSKWPYIIVGVTLYIDNALVLGAYANTTFARAILIHYLGPIWVALYELSPQRRTKYNLIRPLYTIMLAIISVVGLFTMINPESSTSINLGDMYAFLSSFTLAGLILGQNRLSRTASPSDLMYVLSKWGFIISLPIAIAVPTIHTGKVTVNASAILAAVVCGLLFRGIGTYCYNYGTRYLSGTAASFLGMFEVVGAVLVGQLIYGEIPALFTIIGGIIIVTVNLIMIYPPKIIRSRASSKNK